MAKITNVASVKRVKIPPSRLISAPADTDTATSYAFRVGRASGSLGLVLAGSFRNGATRRH
jgi:hypothetical protein